MMTKDRSTRNGNDFGKEDKTKSTNNIQIWLVNKDWND